MGHCGSLLAVNLVGEVDVPTLDEPLAAKIRRKLSLTALLCDSAHTYLLVAALKQ